VKPIPLFLAASVAIACFGCKKGGEPSAGGGAGGGAASAPAASSPAPSPVSFFGDFEGQIDAVGKDNKPGATPTAFSFLVKGGNMRFAVPAAAQQKRAPPSPMFGEASYVIFDSANKKISVVSDAKKQAMVMDLNSLGGDGPLGAHKEPPPSGSPEKPPPKVTKTGKFDTVAGYKCEIWDVLNEKMRGSLCVAQEDVSWFHLPETFMPREHLWMGELLDGKHLPLRFVELQDDGVTERKRVEVTKIDKRTLSPAEFEVPAGYQVIDLAQMAAAMSGMAGGRDGGMPRLEPMHKRRPKPGP
jgi:hypothetical protein